MMMKRGTAAASIQANDLPADAHDVLQCLVADAERSLRFPHAALRLWRLAQDENTSGREITRLIEREPALAARVLRIANSPVFQHEGQIASIERAVNVIGMREIADLALAGACVAGFSPLENQLLRSADFWWHSFCTALLARDAARAAGLPPDDAFTAGLLHDIGQMMLFSRRGQVMTDVLRESLETERPLHELERTRLGFDHAELGGALLRVWNLPKGVCDAVAGHHLPADALGDPSIARIVRLANLAAVMVETRNAGESSVPTELAAVLRCGADTLAAHLDENRRRVDGFCTGIDL
jgi:putative nucleotidyltransferase with HDIG domain